MTLGSYVDLDLLCAARTAPNQSWRNPVEHMMSIVNLGLQSIGLMRKEVSSEAEKALKNCNSLKQLRSAGEPFRQEISLSIQQPIDLVADVMSRLQLKGKNLRWKLDVLNLKKSVSGKFSNKSNHPFLLMTPQEKRSKTRKNYRLFSTIAVRFDTTLIASKSVVKMTVASANPFEWTKTSLVSFAFFQIK